MPIRLVLFQEKSGAIPPLEWFANLPLKAQQACRTKLQLLAVRGHQLDRPASAYLGKGIYELRIKIERHHYRVLYLFHGTALVVLLHGFLKKQAAVPSIEIDRALRRKAAYLINPQRHTATGELPP